MNRYRETLHRWAEQIVPEGARVVAVDIDYDDGWDPTFTDRPESLSVRIAYRQAGHTFWADMSMERLTTVGELLTELFSIEDKDDK